MEIIEFSANGKPVRVEADPDMPLAYVLRERLGLTGTKVSCGAGLCGACTVHIDGEPERSCSIPVGHVRGRAVVTIEGLSKAGDHPLQRAWRAEQVPQCGFCQSGQIMQAAALLNRPNVPTRAEIVDHMADNLCRCGTYGRIIRAIERAAREHAGQADRG
jgi:isoquinoline 1-oxidoreductase subunit alpha